MKSLLAANRSEKDSFRIPHSVQQSIPIRRIYTDGMRHSVERPAISMEGGKSLWSGLPPPSD